MTWSRNGSQLTAPRPGRALAQQRQRGDHAGKARHETLRIVAGEGEAGARRRRRRRRLGAGLAGKSQHDRRGGDGVGEPLVVGGQHGRRAGERGELRDVGKQLGELGGREAVGLGEDEIEGDRAGAGLVQGVDDGGKARARPRPLADAGERGLVDVDDAHGVAGSAARGARLR